MTSTPYTVGASPVTLSPVEATFYRNPSSSGPFDTSQLSSPLWTETFPVVNFDPPGSAQEACANASSINISPNTRPFTDVISTAKGTCTTEIAESSGGTMQAGSGTLNSFEAVYLTKLTVAQSGQIISTCFPTMVGYLHLAPTRRRASRTT